MRRFETKGIKNYWKPIALAAFILISIKPVVFTWHFIRASLAIHLETDRYRAGEAISDTVSYKPSTYTIFNRTTPRVLEHYLARTAVYAHRPQLLETQLLEEYPDVIKPSRLRSIFKDNFYVQHLMGGLDQKRDWRYLDDLSLHVLADKGMNHTTIAILEKIADRLGSRFLKNMADYCHWQGNTHLARYLVSTYKLEDAPLRTETLTPAPGGRGAMIGVLKESYNLSAADVGANLLQCPGFQETDQWENHWYFAKMAGKKSFPKGSFVMGTGRAGDSGSINRVIRLMGFFTGQAPGKSRPRAGVRYRGKFPAEHGVYLFSFDYLTVTGSEGASFWLSNGLQEQRLKNTAKKWKTVVFLLDNSANSFTLLNPLIRMWGTGTLLVDNVFLAKILDPRFSITGHQATVFPGDAQ